MLPHMLPALPPSDAQYMRRALELARRARSRHAPNPKVGAVIVHQHCIIGEGYHEQYGQAHAEVNAVKSILPKNRTLLPESTIYVTLEPCFHYGKTPPCVELILKERIPRVVIACQDPFAKVAGQSIALLKERGVEVVVGVLEAEAKWLMRRFLTSVEQQRPYVFLKWAQSRDGYLGKTDRRVLISNPISQYWNHRWRGEQVAILVGTNTAALDNPRLNNRLSVGPNPIRLVLDRSLRLTSTLHLLDNKTPTWVFTKVDTPPTSTPDLRYVSIPSGIDFLPWFLGFLNSERIQSVLVEGGAQLLSQFIEASLWDEAQVWQSPRTLNGGVAAPCIDARYLYRQTQHLDNYLLSYRR